MSSEELHNLQAQYESLQHEKVKSFEKFELSKRDNEEYIKMLRERNKDLRMQLAKAQKKAVRTEAAILTEDVDEEKLQSQLSRARARHDALKAESTDLTKSYKFLRQEVKSLQQQEAAVSDNAETRKIRQLENRLDKAMIKFNEAQGIGKTYEQILQRLEQERVGFDSQLGAIEDAIKSKQKDLNELESLEKEAQSARDNALQRLRESQHEARTERERRISDLRKAEGRAIRRTKRKDQVHARQQRRLDLLLGRSYDAEGYVDSSRSNNKLRTSELQELRSELKQLQRKSSIYAEVFHRLQHATGVQSENDVIQRVLAQDDQRQHLEDLTSSHTAKIVQMKEELETLQQYADQVQFRSNGGPSPSRGGRGSQTAARQAFDNLEQSLNDAQSRLSFNKNRFERASRNFVDLQAGIGHLVDRLTPIRAKLGLKVDGSQDPDSLSAEISIEDQDPVVLLRGCRAALATAHQDIPSSQFTCGRYKHSFGQSPMAQLSAADGQSAEPRTVQFSSHQQLTVKDINSSDSDSDASDDGADVMSRTQLKQQARSNVSAKVRSSIRRAHAREQQQR